MLRGTITQRFPREGARFSCWRRNHHITQQAFGDFAGVSKATVISYEKGRGIKPSMAEIIEYAKKRLMAHPEEIEAIRSKKEHYWWEEEA